MKRMLYTLMSLVLITALFTGCGGGSSPTAGAGANETVDSSSTIGAFSIVGGWKSENGVIYILKEDGSGLLLSELQLDDFEGNPEDYGIAPIYKSNITWKEDAETATITRLNQEYLHQKKSEGGQETLQIEDRVFSRISESEIKDYEVKAENAGDLDALPQKAENETADSKDDKKIEFSDVILLDNDLVTVELVQFYEKEYNWVSGTQLEKCLTLKVHNNSEKETRFNLYDGYVNDESVTIIMEDGNVGPAPGKTKTYSYCIQYNTSPDATPLESLEDLYTFDAEIETYAYENKTASDSTKTRFCINDIINGVNDSAEDSGESDNEADAESNGYDISVEEIRELLQGEWESDYGSGGSFYFSDDSVTVISNGMALNGTYEVNEEKSCVDLYFVSSEGNTMVAHLPYKIDDGEVILMNNENVEMTKK